MYQLNDHIIFREYDTQIKHSGKILIHNFDSKNYLVLPDNTVNVSCRVFVLGEVLDVINQIQAPCICVADIDSYDRDSIVLWSSNLEILGLKTETHKVSHDYMICIRCKNRYQYVEPNLPNKKYICYNCRS